MTGAGRNEDRIPRTPGPSALRLLKLIEADPGVTMLPLKERLGLGWNAFHFNLDTLVHYKLAVTRKNSESDVTTHAYPAHYKIPKYIPRPLSPTEERIGRILIRSPGIDVQDIIDQLGDERSNGHVLKTLREMREAKLITRESTTRNVGLRATPKLIDQLLGPEKQD